MFGGWELFYLGAFLSGLGYLLMLVVGGQLGGGHDAQLGTHLDVGGHPDLHLEAHAEAGGHSLTNHPEAGDHEVAFLTPTVIASMLAGVGGLGLFATLTLGLPWLLHLPAAALGGWFVGYLAYLLYAKIIVPSQGSSEVHVADLWGTVGEVTTPIPANRLGEIRFVASGSYVSTAARSATGEGIPRGALVIIEKVENSVAVVRLTT
ncbi:MAG TPA: NfeD family protein [Ardenticatenaceae bacterium]|jgi:hypothetical protein